MKHIKLAVLVGILAGGVWICGRLENRRALREQMAAVSRLVAAGGVLVTELGRDRFTAADAGIKLHQF